MPFQGNGGRGVIDPQIFQMLMQEQKSQQDSQSKMLADFMKVQAEQAKEARAQAKEKRDIAAHEEEMRNKQADRLGKLKGLLETTSEQGEATGVTAETLPQLFAAQQALGLSQNTSPENVFTNNANPNFDFSQAPWNPQLIQQDRQQTEAAIPLAQEFAAKNPTGTLMDRTYQDIGGMYDQPPVEIAQRAALQGVVGQRAEKKELDKTIAAEQRQALKEKELARYKEGLTRSRFAGEITNLTDQILAQEQVLATTPPGTPKYERTLLLKSRFEGGMTKLLSENVDPGHFANVQKFMDDNVSLIQESEAALQDLYKFRDLAKTNPNFLGTTRGGLIQFVTSVTEGAADVVGLTNLSGAEEFAGLTESARSTLLRDDTLTAAERTRLSKELGFGTDGTLQARTDAASLTNRIAFLVTRLQNPGRFSNEQYKINRGLYDMTSGSAQQSFRNLLTGIAELESGAERVRTRVGLYKNLVPGAGGGLSTPEGGAVLPPTPATPFPSVGGVQATPPAPTAAPAPKATPPSTQNWTIPFQQNPQETQADIFLKASPEERAAIIESLMRN